MQRLTNRSIFVLGPILLVSLFASAAAYGGGIEIPMQDSRAAGQADAVTAHSDDAAAVFYNPACLTLSHGTEVSVGAYGLFPEWRFDAAAGRDEAMRLPSLLPHVYAASDLGTDRWRFGIGVNNVFGLNEDWGDRGPLRTLVDKAKLTVINASVAAAYKVDEHLSVGAALNVYYGELMLSRNVTLGAPPTPEGKFHLRGHDFAVGITPSVLYKIDDRNSIGAYYRSPFTLNLTGETSLGTPAGEIGPSHSVTPLDLPQSIGMGYSVKATDRLRLETDVIWTDWTSVNELKIHSADAHFNGQAIPADWKAGFTVRLGGEYDLAPHWVLRGGYAWSQNSVPESTFSPLVPDSNYHLFSVGIGYTTDRWSLDGAYQYIYRERRHIQNDINSPVVNGTWDNAFQGVMVTFTYKM